MDKKTRKPTPALTLDGTLKWDLRGGGHAGDATQSLHFNGLDCFEGGCLWTKKRESSLHFLGDSDPLAMRSLKCAHCVASHTGVVRSASRVTLGLPPVFLFAFFLSIGGSTLVCHPPDDQSFPQKYPSAMDFLEK